MKNILIVLLIGVVIFLAGCTNTGPSVNDDFAKCLSAKGAKMYGAFWCPHCKDQKASFGNAWQYVNYIECSTPDGKDQLSVCKDANIQGYPTWEFADGSRLVGQVSMQELSLKTGCALPK